MQDLIYRVVKLYFETLQASDEIDLLQAQRKEILAQLAEAEAMFNAGLVSITDVNETKTKAALIEVEQLNAVQLFKIKKILVYSNIKLYLEMFMQMELCVVF